MRINPSVAALCSLLWATLAAGQACAGCLMPPAVAQAVNQFKSNPKGLIGPGVDTRTVEGLVRDLAGTDASLAKELVRVAMGTQPRYQKAIAAGLAQAAIACANTDQQAALSIQQTVASFQYGQFQASFAAVAGDLSTAATDAAASSAASSVGSVAVINPNVSSTATTLPGGGGTTEVVLLTFAGVTVIGEDKASKAKSSGPSDVTTTAATPVSATR
jgi:hypothetical protein